MMGWVTCSSSGILALFVIFSSIFLYLSRRPSFPETAPPIAKEGLPILGMTRFFTNRWDFFRGNAKKSKSGHFSYWIGRNRMVGVSGTEGRHQLFYDSAFNMEEGINLLFGGTSRYTSHGESFNVFFLRRINRALKGDRFTKMLPALVSDVKMWITAMRPTRTTAVTDPFESVYGVVMQLTTRMVLCEELANDPAKQKQLLRWNEMVENSTTATTIIFPRFPSWALLQRLYAGTRLYMTFNDVIEKRLKSDKRHDDALQIYLDFKDDARMDTILLLTASLFSGVVNSGINGCWILMYLAQDRHWRSTVLDEIRTVAAKYGKPSQALLEQLESLPLEAWESDFPMLYLCFRETIRLQTTGSIIRKNSSCADIALADSSGQIIPAGSYATYHLFDAHLNPSIYTDPEKWDPARFLPGREEDRKVADGYLGWGLGRHVCAGMRFAKLEGVIVTAFWMAAYEWEVEGDRLPALNFNASAAHKPSQEVRFRYWPRKEEGEKNE